MTYNSTVLADAPQHYITFDQSTGTYTDSGSQNKTTTVYGTPTRVPGISGTALHYNGTTDYVTINSPYDFGASSTFTFECWVKSTAATNNPTMIRRDGGGAAYLLRFNSGKIEFYCNTTGVITTATYADGNWHHVVGVKSGTTSTLYVDGVQVGTAGATTVAQASGAQPVYLGESTSAATEMYNGTLDEVAIYSTALTAAKVTAHYNAAFTNVTATPPVMTGTLSTVVPAFVGSVVNDTVAVPAMTLSLATPNAAFVLSETLTETSSTGGVGTSGQVWRFGSGYNVSYQFTNASVPSGKRIKSATLNLTLTNQTGVGNATPGHTMNVQIDRYATTFGSGSIVTTNEATATFTVPSTTATGTVAIDVTGIVKDLAAGATNAGIRLAWTAGGTATTSEYIGISDLTASAPMISVDLEDIPPTNINVAPPAMTLSLSDPTPVVTVVDSITQFPVPFSVDVEFVGGSATAAVGVTTVAPVMTGSLTFVGGVPALPDYSGAAGVISMGLSAPNANGFVEYDVTVAAPAIAVGTVDTPSGVAIDLTTNRLTAVPAMGLSLKWPGIYIESADRYLTMLPSTLDQDDIWYKMDEASGTRVTDSEVGGTVATTYAASGLAWEQGGYLFGGGQQFRISDGPELRPAMSFNGTTDYMVVGPYPEDNKYVDMEAAVEQPNDVYFGMSATIEFSIRTSQTDGVVFAGTGAQPVQPLNFNGGYSAPVLNGNELRLEAGYLVVANKSGNKIKARQFISDGQWHHIVMAIPDSTSSQGSDPLTFDGRTPAYIAIDGQPVLVRYGNFLGDSLAYAEDWLPYSVMARATPLIDTINRVPLASTTVSGFLAADMRDFIVRLNSYQSLTTTEKLYYEWSNSTVLYPDVMTASLSTVDPFSAKGNVKKMLALYGLPMGYDAYQMPIDTYLSTLSGMVIKNFGNVTSAPNGSTFGSHTPVYQQVKAFMLEGYLVYPVDYTGGRYADTDTTSVAGVLDRSSSFLYEHPDGRGYGGFADDTTGLPRFINLQDDLIDVSDFDVITVVNYPWVVPNAKAAAQTHNTGGATSSLPNDGELCQSAMGLSGVEWTEARNALRDSILEAAYDGVNLWIGEYHMAQHLGFIESYDVHDFGHLTGTKNTRARDLDALHGASSSGYLGSVGEFNVMDQKLTRRRVVAEIPGLTDLPTNDQTEGVSGWSYNRWQPDGDFTAHDIIERPNGLVVGDETNVAAIDGEFAGVASTQTIPYTMFGPGYGFWNGSVGADGPGAASGLPQRKSIFSAEPGGVVGTPVTAEMTGHYDDNGVWVDNPFKDNVFTIAAEVGTVVRGRAIRGRVFIEMMETYITPTFVVANQIDPKTGKPADLNGTGDSTWDYDSRRDKQVVASLSRTVLTQMGGAIGIQSIPFNYSDYTQSPVYYLRRETMHSRGLNWLSQTPQLNSGDVQVYQTAFTLTLTEPAPAISKTSNETVQVTSSMRLDMEVEQPQNYRTGDVEVRTLPMEMSLDMLGRGTVSSAPVMTVNLSAVAPVILAATEYINVYVDANNSTITLFLKEDN